MSEHTYERNVDRIKVGHLVVGLVFLGFAGTWALAEVGVLGGPDHLATQLVPALVLLGAGLVGLLAMLVGGLNRRTSIREPWQPDQQYAGYDAPTDPEDPTDTTVLKEDQ